MKQLEHLIVWQNTPPVQAIILRPGMGMLQTFSRHRGDYSTISTPFITIQ
jgi:hypothetical protein